MNDDKDMHLPFKIKLINSFIDHLRDEGGTGHDYLNEIEQMIKNRINEKNMDETDLEIGRLEYNKIYQSNTYGKSLAYEHEFGPLGYQWKDIFLPVNTVLRIQYKSKYSHAVIHMDKRKFKSDTDLIYKIYPVNHKEDDPKPYTSPTNFANEATNAQSVKNAKRDIQIKRPHDNKWLTYQDINNLQKQLDRYVDIKNQEPMILS